ncbi:MAG: carboxypeptidase-like regulatory domain-containing protein, partial [Nitrospirota bacterium]
SESSPPTNRIVTNVASAPPDTGSNTSVRDHSSEVGPRTKKIAADRTAASPEIALNANGRERSSEAGLRAKKSAPDTTAATAETKLNTTVRDRSPEAGPATSKITDNGPASIQGFVKDAKGEPITGADLRIESRDGKQVFRTVKTDPNGRYTSQGLQPGIYRVTLVVNGAVKASIMNTRTKTNQPTQLNFDFKGTSQAGAITKARKHMVWVPNRTGSHIGGTWIEVDDKGNEHSESNMQTYAPRR